MSGDAAYGTIDVINMINVIDTKQEETKKYDKRTSRRGRGHA